MSYAFGKLDQDTARSLNRGPELDLLNVLKRDEARYAILREDDHKRRDIRIHFFFALFVHFCGY